MQLIDATTVPYGNMPDLFTECVLAEWKDGDLGERRFLGDDPDHSFNMTIRLNAQNSELLLWFQLIVKVKRHYHSTNSRQRSLYFVVQADMFDYYGNDRCLSLQPMSDISPCESTSVALTKGNYSPVENIFRLRFKLKTCGQVIMPKASSPLIPASEQIRTLLTRLRSLSRIKEFDVYIPLRDQFSTAGYVKGPHKQLLGQICESVVAQKMMNHRIDFESFYRNGAEQDAWDNFDLHGNEKPNDATITVTCQHDGEGAAGREANAGAFAEEIECPSTHTTPIQEQQVQRQQHQQVVAATESSFEIPPPQYQEATSTPSGTELDSGPSDRRHTENHTTTVVDTGSKGDIGRSQEGPEDEAEVPLQPCLGLDGDATEEDVSACAGEARVTLSADENGVHKGILEKKRKGNHPAEERANQKPRAKRVRIHVGKDRYRGSRSTSCAVASTMVTSPSSTKPTRSSTLYSTPDSLLNELTEFLVWLASVDMDLQKRYEKLLWDLGDAASAGDGVKFSALQARCKAEVLVSYRRRTPGEIR